MTNPPIKSTWAALYLLLLFVPLALPAHGLPLLVTDIGVLFLLPGWWTNRRELLPMLRRNGELFPFAFWILWVITASLIHFSSGALYNGAVFCYMAFLYITFRQNDITRRGIATTLGILLFTILLATYLYSLHNSASPWFYTDPHGQINPSGALMRRFQFLFGNPNLLGPSYVIPTILVLPALTQRLRSEGTGWLEHLLLLTLALIACLPLLSSASKHLLMTMALFASAFSQSHLLPRRTAVWSAFAMTMIAGMLCLSTVWFRTYPAVKKKPYIDFHHTSNYMVHQEIYAEIVRNATTGHLLTGYSPEQLRELYPETADPDRVRSILHAYRFDDWTEQFCTFMDPHNEYLNTASLAGLPALTALLAFILWMFVKALRCNQTELLFFIPAMLLCCLWDDLLSKRCVWCAFGMLSALPPKQP